MQTTTEEREHEHTDLIIGGTGPGRPAKKKPTTSSSKNHNSKKSEIELKVKATWLVYLQSCRATSLKKHEERKWKNPHTYPRSNWKNSGDL